MHFYLCRLLLFLLRNNRDEVISLLLLFFLLAYAHDVKKEGFSISNPTHKHQPTIQKIIYILLGLRAMLSNNALTPQNIHDSISREVKVSPNF